MNTRYNCPQCNRSKVFSRYIDTETGEHLSPDVGRCERINNCGYHYTPKEYFEDNKSSLGDDYYSQKMSYQTLTKLNTQNKKDNRTTTENFSSDTETVQPQPVSFIPIDIFKGSLKSHEKNHFVTYLKSLFGVEVKNQLVGRYFIGTSKHWEAATVFWQIDTHGKIRAGKIMLYNPATGKRVKEPNNHIAWTHKAMKGAYFDQEQYHLKQCLFGEHLLQDKTNGNDKKSILLFESEKTTVIASVYFPQFISLATGGAEGLNKEKCETLNDSGRHVFLFPDASKPKEGKETVFEKWTNTAKKYLFKFTVSDLLECKATEEEKKRGVDLADYLVKLDYKRFIEPQNLAKLSVQDLIKLDIQEEENLIKSHIENSNNLIKPECWSREIAELDSYFANTSLPNIPITLSQSNRISNVSLFVENHFATVKANNGKQAFLPYLSRLQELRQVLNTKSY